MTKIIAVALDRGRYAGVKMVPASDSDPGIVKVDFYLGLTTEYEL